MTAAAPPAAPPTSAAARSEGPRLAPVDCSAPRVIRTITGLRPYRPSGFAVRVEKLGPKTLIHNYGHGGAGITLSWGTAKLALDEALRSGHREFAVLGCGVIGLTTARLFQLHGLQVKIYAKQAPPDTTSNIAGGLWSPVTLYESGRQSASFSAQFVPAARFAHRYFQSLAGPRYGVRWLPMYNLSNAASSGPPPENPFPEIRQIMIDGRSLAPEEHPFPTARATRMYSMLIEPAIFLDTLIRDFHIAGGRLAIRDFRDAAEVATLGEPGVVNCTGLGARALFADQELTPVKGQLVFLPPQPEVQYMTIGPSGLYMFPRHDGILLGGTHEEGNWDLTPDAAQTERIVNGHADLFGRMKRG